MSRRPLKHHFDDFGTDENEVRKTVCFNADSIDEKAEAEKLWEKTYDSSIVCCKLIQFSMFNYIGCFRERECFIKLE